jgi:amino acid transporter
MGVAVPLIYTLYVVYVGGDYKPTFRFYATPALFLAALGGVGADLLAEWISRGRAAALYLVRLALVGAAGATLLMTGQPARTFAQWRADELPVHREAGPGVCWPPEMQECCRTNPDFRQSTCTGCATGTSRCA